MKRSDLLKVVEERKETSMKNKAKKTANKKLLPCPFCGASSARAVKVLSSNFKVLVGWNVVCEPDEIPCGAEGPITNTQSSAVKAWQKRVG